MNNFENEQYNSYERKPLSYYIKKFLITFLFVVLFIFVLLLLFPTKSALNPLYDRIFQDNINTMKEVSEAYFTTDRLPKKEGDTVKLTLKDMLDMKLLLAIKDKNGNTCDVNKSYVEITKLEKEYKLKVNLKCGSEEDYILTYLGCYNYCLNDVCEKKKEKKVTKKVVPIVGPTKYYCRIVNGKYYNNNGKVVSKAAYQKACTTKKYKYQYAKTVKVCHDKKYSAWSGWSKDIEYNPNTSKIDWGKHELEWNEKNGSKTITTTKLVNDLTKPIYQKQQDLIGYKTKYACGNYDFYVDQTTNTTYKVTSGWQSAGKITSSKILNSSRDVKYVIDSIEYDNCNNDTCSITPKYTYVKYTRVSSKTTEAVDSDKELTAVCTDIKKLSVPVYAYYDEFVAYEKKKVTITETIYYYHKKTRKVEKDAYCETKKYTAWSYSKNDSKLKKQGYKYTGKRKLV